ncbi:hypothetical protein DFH07DRAFT_734921 [Mycena maculata]|uniref:2OGFeDO JBP1/TET oxygenase domain-containing protein n=3 Tax=Mycena maculata TaxID=230809 RepID=A0AAD7NQ86_9AGAR|nr:hypothetical protein DFH07DRAFT_734921 [Mycena maculata]
MPGEFKDEDSRRKFFQYLSVHYVWYARFGEKGDGAPADVHPDNLRKEGKGKSNLYQRLPRESKELQQNKEEYKRIADAFTDFFDLVRVAVSALFKLYLGIEYDQVSMFAETLPLGASSPAYPFSGFVLNISSCTWSHRDGDKVMCFVIPLGEFEGGQLGLYEVGFSFDLKMGDVLAFPSCHLTHFNCHFKGRRATIVLHTDPKGDAWAEKCNGWQAHVVRHRSTRDKAKKK